MLDKIIIKGCSEDSVFSSKNNTFLKMIQVIEKLQEAFSDYRLGSLANRQISVSSDSKKWFSDGIYCEILEPGKGWQKGKMRLKVNVEAEFIPDEPETTKPESPLDDLRQKL